MYASCTWHSVVLRVGVSLHSYIFESSVINVRHTIKVDIFIIGMRAVILQIVFVVIIEYSSDVINAATSSGVTFVLFSQAHCMIEFIPKVADRVERELFFL